MYYCSLFSPALSSNSIFPVLFCGTIASIISTLLSILFCYFSIANTCVTDVSLLHVSAQHILQFVFMCLINSKALTKAATNWLFRVK